MDYVPYHVDQKYADAKAAPVTKDPNLKGMEHCVAKAQEIYSSHINSFTGVPFSKQAKFHFLRLYGDGNQPEEIYTKYFFGDNNINPDGTPISTDGTDLYKNQTRESNRKSFMNVMWRVISLAPKIVSALVGSFEQSEYDIVADPLDAMSKTLKENRKAELWFKSMNKDFEKRVMGKMRVPYKEDEFLPETKQELDLYDEIGGFKESYAMIMEMLIKHTFDISDWGETRKRLITDAVNIGVFATKDYYCDRDQKIKTKYIDPDRLVIQRDDNPYNLNSEFAGHFEDWSISQLREKGFTEDQLAGVAKYFSGYAGNPEEEKWNNYNVPATAGYSMSYDFYKVCVFVCEWVEIDGKQDKILTNKYGRKVITPQQYGDVNKEKDSYGNPIQTRVTDLRMKYQCYWLVGSDLAFDCGPCYDITRPKKNLREVNLSYHVYNLPGLSVTERLIPIYDNFQILWIKFQSALAAARNAGYAIDYDAISAIKMGGGKFTEEDVIRRFLETGNLIFRRTSVQGRQKTGSSIPVYELKSNISDAFVQFREGFNLNISMIETLTGFSPMMIGGQADPNAPVATSGMAQEATINTLRPLMTAYRHTKKEIAENITLWIQILVKSDRMVETSYTEVIGEDNIKILKEAENNGVYYGINLIPRPTTAEKQEIFETAKVSLSNGRDGAAGISEADYFMILHILSSGGSMRLAQMLLENAIRRDKKQKDEMAQQNMQIQQQGALQLKQEETQSKTNEIQLAKDLELRNKQEEHRMKMEELQLQAALKPEAAIK
jgi:hypothetical protein